METRFLETFLVVAEFGSLAEASRRLGITPAAVAQRMQALEDEIGIPLLVRSGRRVKPTEAGHAILEKSRRILSDVHHLRSLACNDMSGELRLGAISTALTGLLPSALRHVRSTMPDVEVFLLPGTSADLYQTLLNEKIDATIVVKPPFALPKTLEWRLLRSEPLVLMAPASADDATPHELLRSKPFIRYDRNNWGGRLADHYLQENEIRPKEWLELDSLEAIGVMVENELGVSLVPDWSAPWHQSLNVLRLPLPRRAMPREIGMVWPRHSPCGKLVAALLAALERGPSSNGT
ncbi:LysR family transcriptional regulator [Brucella sp. IR073]|uniref:LysR family transcriptional regulator n=1 Tax=unclassified Brucella TaxID=2632610 RepID=UPI003B97F983